MSEAVNSQTLEQSLNKTDFGHMIYENRKIFLAALIAVLVGSTAYIFWKQARDSKALNSSVKVFEFQSGPWADAKAGKLATPELIKTFEGLDENIRNAPVMIPVVLEMSKFLFEKGSVSEAEAILSKVGEVKHPVSAFFINLQKAVVYEKLGKTDEAIAALEKLAQTKDGLMSARVSIELGRLYLIKGEKGKAQTQFDYVVSTFPNDEQAKVAKLYLSQLK